MSQVCILDFGGGNITSVKNALTRLGIPNKVSNSIKDIDSASHLILPGVGSFDNVVNSVHSKLPVSHLLRVIENGKPILGICVGMQIFAEKGYEFEESVGLNLFPKSYVVELPANSIKPHMGWNNIKFVKKSKITEGLDPDSDFYFVHSFYITGEISDYCMAICEYIIDFPAIIEKNNIVGVQFHPEKSQLNGDKILKNFVFNY